MRRTIRAILVVGALAGIGSAAPLCVNGTIADYIALGSGGCQISDKLFSNFLHTSTGMGNGVAVSSTAVNVIPDFSDPFNPGFHFSSSDWTVFSLATDTVDSFVDSSIQFRAEVIGGAALMEDNTLSLDVFLATGEGVGAIDETLLPSGQRFHVDTLVSPVDHQTFAPTSFVNVTKDLFIGSPAGTPGFVSISQFSENFSELNPNPEPLSFLLMGSGLLGVGLWRRSRR